MRYQLWEESDPDGWGGLSLVLRGTYDDRMHLLGARPIMVLEFEAATWEEACQRQHDFYGWEPYRP